MNILGWWEYTKAEYFAFWYIVHNHKTIELFVHRSHWRIIRAVATFRTVRLLQSAYCLISNSKSMKKNYFIRGLKFPGNGRLYCLGFRRFKKPRCGKMSGRSYTLLAYAPTSLFLSSWVHIREIGIFAIQKHHWRICIIPCSIIVAGNSSWVSWPTTVT